MKRGAILWGAAAALALGAHSPAMARPAYLQAFKATYKTPNVSKATCGTCHVGAPRDEKWNPYGQTIRRNLGAVNVSDMAKIVAALKAAERGRNRVQMKTFGALIAEDKLPNLGIERRVAQPSANRPPASPRQAPRVGNEAPVSYGQWQSLFNGVNLDGWTKMNQGDWSVENGYLKYRAGTGNGWLRTNQMYNNYALVVVWRYTQPGEANDSGIFLKAKSTGGNPWPQSPQLNMGPYRQQNVGSISGTSGTRNRMDLVKQNDWNTFQVTLFNGKATLAINNQVAWEQAMGNNESLTGPGYIGIENEGPGIEFAQIWIMPLQ